MPETSLEEVIQEKDFARLLEKQAASYFRLCNALLSRSGKEWKKKHFYKLTSECSQLETFLDDYGAQYNRNYSCLRELVASSRWFALSGFSLAHLRSRMSGYQVLGALSSTESADALDSIERARGVLRGATERLLAAIRDEALALGMRPSADSFPEDDFEETSARMRLPRNLGQDEPGDEKHKIAEVASKFLAACGMFDELSIRRIHDPAARAGFLARTCTEEHARVYEATVHNLQSTYDTYIKNTVVESHDTRLARLRGHTSAALHLLEAVTFLTHFVERHEGGLHSKQAEQRISELIDRRAVQDIILNVLLYWANRFMDCGRTFAADLLPTYTNVQELAVELPDDVQLHARPAALIVAIVGKHGTPVEMEVDGHRCNAASILELLVTVGSHPDARRFVFRGDENPLRDISLLFQFGLGEAGIERLPRELEYLRASDR